MLIAGLCAAMLSAVVAREGVATRTSSLGDAASAEVSQAFTPAAERAFDVALQSAVADTLQAPPASQWRSIVIERGSTLSTIFDAEGLPPAEWMELVSLGADAAKLKHLKVGEKINLRKSAEQRLEELTYELDEQHTLQIRRSPEGQLEAMTLAAEMERRKTQAAGVIDSSLFVAGQKAGLSNRLVMELAELFGYDVDFALDLREGDRFSVVYDEIYRNGERLRDGSILAAEFINQGRVYRAMRHEDAQGRIAYYTPEGESLRKAFFRSPVDFARVSSGFNLKRRHPILNTIRAHKGVDYAAGTGTPIKATGDGRVEFMGIKGGYGRVVILKHGAQYTTLYAHMSRYRSGLKVGSRVKQGQVIGYVGASGLATAPHLHYEFRIGGLHKNPMTVVLPRSNPLPRSVVAQWRSENEAILSQLDALSGRQMAQAIAEPQAVTPAIP